MSDASVTRMMEASFKFPREIFGFTPLKKGEGQTVRILPVGRMGKYDVALEFSGVTSRTICLSLSDKDGKYRWVSEREVFYEPNARRTSPSFPREYIELLYEARPVFGTKSNELQIRYVGPVKELQNSPHPLSLKDVAVLLKAWSSENPALRETPREARVSAESAIGKW